MTKCDNKTGELMRIAREEKGLSRAKLAEISGCSSHLIYLWETGRRVPKLSSLNKFAQALNISASDLF